MLVHKLFVFALKVALFTFETRAKHSVILFTVCSDRCFNCVLNRFVLFLERCKLFITHTSCASRRENADDVLILLNRFGFSFGHEESIIKCSHFIRHLNVQFGRVRVDALKPRGKCFKHLTKTGCRSLATTEIGLVPTSKLFVHIASSIQRRTEPALDASLCRFTRLTKPLQEAIKRVNDCLFTRRTIINRSSQDFLSQLSHRFKPVVRAFVNKG